MDKRLENLHRALHPRSVAVVGARKVDDYMWLRNVLTFDGPVYSVNIDEREIPGIEAPFIAKYTSRVSWFVYVIRFLPGLDRDAIAQKLAASGIPARPYFLPIHLQPYMVDRFGYREGIFPVTEDLGKRGLALPFSGVMQEEQVERVCQVLRKVII